MKAKKILSMIIAAAMAMQCAVISAVASEPADGVTVVASDSTTDWKMGWNWARFEEGFSYHSSYIVEDGFRLSHDSDKHYAVDAVKYLDGSIYKFRLDSEGKPVAYNAEDTTSTTYSWYYNSRHSYVAEFAVGETQSDTRPAVISFTYKSTNPATNCYGNEPATSYTIVSTYNNNENLTEAFRIYPNYKGNGLQIKYYDASAGAAAYKQLGLPKDDAEHDIKVVISPQLTSDGRYQMEAISVDGEITKLENIYGLTAGMTDMLINRIIYRAGIRVSPSFEDEIKNLIVQRGIDNIKVSASVSDEQTDVIPDGIKLSFSDAVQLAEGAVKVYENGTAISSDSYTVTMSADNKTATVSIPEYKGRTAYKLVVDKTFVSGLLGGEVENSLEVDFVTAKNIKIVASDSTTDWEMMWNWTRFEEGFGYHSSWSVKNGFKLSHDNDKEDAVDKVKYKESGVYKFRLDSNGTPVAYNAEDTTSKTYSWYYENRHGYMAQFLVGETEGDTKPAVVSFTFRTTNGATAWYSNEPATMYSIVGGYTGVENYKEAFRIYPNYNGNGLQIAYYDASTNATAYKQLGLPRDDAEHDIEIVISPELTSDGRYQMEAILVDGKITKLENIYGLTAGMSDMLIDRIIYKSGIRVPSSFEDEIKNLTVYRGIDNIAISSSVSNEQTDVIPDSIKLSFSDAVQLEEGAVKVYENGTAMSSDSYTVTMSADNKTATVSIPVYKSRTEYKITVDKALVIGLLGNELEEDFEVSFVTAKKVDAFKVSENLASGYTVELYNKYGPTGQKFTTVTTDEDGVTTITIDNAKWNVAKEADWVYDGETVGYSSGDWDYAGVDIKNFTDVKNSTDPIVISMDYAYENMLSSSDNNDIWLYTGDTANAMYYLSPFGASPAVSGASWGGKVYANNVTETDWHSVQYVIDPTIDENKKTHMTQITFDEDVIKDTAQNWISYGTADDADEYLNKIEMRIKRQTATDANGNVLPTVLKMKNFKIVRAKEFNVAVDSVALTNTENTLSLRFSDPVTEGELANLKVMKGTETVENPISAISLASDGLSAKLTMNLDATARYTLVTSEVADIYGVKSSTAPVEFEYYNISDGYVTIAEAGKADDGTNTTVSFTFTASKTAAPMVIVAAYDEDCSLMGVGMKSISLTSKTDASDSITLEKVTGADKIQIMAWDSLENMKPYCMAKTID